MRLAVIGAGYVGLVTGTCFAELGFHVSCIDKDRKKISSLTRGKIPIFEPGLPAMVSRNVRAGRLSFGTDLESAVREAAITIIAVGTPPDPETGGADLSHVYAVAREISRFLPDRAVVVTKSTVPVGTGREIAAIIAKARPRLRFSVASNPEFLREGCAVKDFMEPDRIIVGAESQAARKIMRALYKPLTKKAVPLIFTDIATAELTKYAANAFLAAKIAFINEIADVCEKTRTNVTDVALGMGMDRRIGKDYLKPGPGFGGSCFPKDTLALRKMAQDCGAPSKIIEAVIHSNERRKLAMAEKIIRACGGSVRGKNIAVLGLAFKANTDDMRHSATLIILPELLKAGARVSAYDPEAMDQARQALNHVNIRWCEDSYDAAKGADAVVIITEWEEFRSLDWGKIKKATRSPVLVDMRNILKAGDMRSLGFHCTTIGCGT